MRFCRVTWKNASARPFSAAAMYNTCTA
jgi:hypothetical protein